MRSIFRGASAYSGSLQGDELDNGGEMNLRARVTGIMQSAMTWHVALEPKLILMEEAVFVRRQAASERPGGRRVPSPGASAPSAPCPQP